MLPLDPKRVAELQRRLAARQLREEDFQILPDLLASFRQLAQWLSDEDMTEERLQALLLGSENEAAEAAHGQRAKSRPPRSGQSAPGVVARRSRNRRT
jgi:hypothetical protein